MGVKLHRLVCAHRIFAAVWSMPEKFWSIFVSEIHYTKHIFSLLTHCVRHKRHISKIKPKPIDLQNGKRMDSWCKHYLFLAYSGTCLDLSKQFSQCYLSILFKTPVIFFFLVASLLLILFNNLHVIVTFSAIEKLHELNVSPTPCSFQGGTARESIPCAGLFKGLRIKLPKVLRCLCSSYILSDCPPCMVTRTELRFCITVFQYP